MTNAIKEMITPAHILDARHIAHTIFDNKPKIQVEMLEEVKKTLVNLNSNNSLELENI